MSAPDLSDKSILYCCTKCVDANMPLNSTDYSIPDFYKPEDLGFTRHALDTVSFKQAYNSSEV